jgi:hypothetical protein
MNKVAKSVSTSWGSFRFSALVLCLSFTAHAQSQAPPNLFNALSWSSVFNQTVYNSSGKSIGVLNQAVPNVYAFGANGSTISLGSVGATLPVPSFQVDTSIVKVNNAVNSSIATALSLIPLASPASGVIYQTDPATGVQLPAASTLGTVFTERAETIGKRRWYFGVTHQDFHFTKLNGQSLNGLQVVYPGGTPSGIKNLAGTGNLSSFPATFDVGMDVRLSQNLLVATYGITDRLDVSVGIPMVHAAVAARTYNGIIYDGDGAAGQTGATVANPNCWCAGTFNPGAYVSPTINFTLPNIGQSNLGKTGIGDVLFRLKGTVVQNSHIGVAVGGEVRAGTGKAQDYLGTGTTSVKPFAALSLYTAPSHGIVFAPHVNVGWQFSGQSVLGGQLQPNTLTATMNDGSGIVTYNGAPLTATKGYLPDVFSWAVGTEVALGRRNTLVADILGNDIGWIHGAPSLVSGSFAGYSPTTLQAVNATGLMAGANLTTSFSQYSGSFGYKARLVGNLVLTFNALVRFDSNGLTARFAPLYGLGYTF